MRPPLNTSKARSALVLCPEPPYPARGGGQLRTASLIEYLARDHCVDLVIFEEDGKPVERPAAAREVFVIRLPQHSRRLLARIARNVSRLARGVAPLVDRFAGQQEALKVFLRGRRWDVALLKMLWLAPYAETVRPHAGRLVLDLHDVESVLMAQIAPMFAPAARRAEARWLPCFDRILAASPEDARRIGRGAVVYPNAIPARPMPERREEFAIAMSGNFEYFPNRQGRRWFERRVWPSLAEEFSGLEWRLIGKGANPVDDAVAEIARAQVAVVPILSGSGTRLKILEAWAAGSPVVSTTLGAEGLECEPGRHLLIADSPQSFRGAVARLLRDADLRQRLRVSAHELLHLRFTWPRAWERLEKNGGLY
jgi:glycosyltransferase involved in cell wall biosynthesis